MTQSKLEVEYSNETGLPTRNDAGFKHSHYTPVYVEWIEKRRNKRGIPEIKWVKTHEDAILPVRSHIDPLTGDVGYDIFATEDISIAPHGSVIIGVGLTVAYITPGYWFRIEPRSGNGFGKDIIPFLGVIDNSYRNNLGVKLYNHSSCWQHIEKGKGVAQLIVYEMIETKMSWADEIVPVEEGARGLDAFGSTDENNQIKK